MEKFTIDKETWNKIKKWQQKQIKINKSNYTLGERWSYIFTPTGLGTIISVKDNILNVEKDFTNYDYW